MDTRRAGLWIHYRLGSLSDPVLAAMTDAVRHALLHLEDVQKDADPLAEPHWLLPALVDASTQSCCAPASAPVSFVKQP